MKNIKILVLTFLVVFGLGSTKVAQAQYGNVSFQLFYEELAPYGEWVYDNQYGDVWIPYAEEGFQPYSSNGYWEQTNYGNTWVSGYDWGWAPFHYGRWNYSNNYGWAWIPGYEWAPAWVSWRSGGGYYGWAPLGPNMSINVSLGIADLLWTFLPSRYIGNRRMHRYYVNQDRRHYAINNTYIINNTRIVNNHYYASGPSNAEIQHSTGRRVSERRIVDASRPGSTRVSSKEVAMYRPNGDANTGGTRTSERNNNRTENRVSNTRTANSRAANSRTENNRNTATRTSNAQQVMHIGKNGDVTRNIESNTRGNINRPQTSDYNSSSRQTTTNNPVRSRTANQGSTQRNQGSTQRSQASSQRNPVSTQRSQASSPRNPVSINVENRQPAITSTRSSTRNNTSSTVSPTRTRSENSSSTTQSSRGTRSSESTQSGGRTR